MTIGNSFHYVRDILQIRWDIPFLSLVSLANSILQTIIATRLRHFKSNVMKFQFQGFHSTLKLQNTSIINHMYTESIGCPWKREAWCLIGRFVAFRPKGRGFESRSTTMYRELGQALNSQYYCLWRFGVKLRHRIVYVLCRERLWIVVDLKRRYRNNLNEWMEKTFQDWASCVSTQYKRL